MIFSIILKFKLRRQEFYIGRNKRKVEITAPSRAIPTAIQKHT